MNKLKHNIIKGYLGKYRDLRKMESLGPDCTKLKQKYEACFYQWYSEKYLTGKSREDECAPLFKEYRECLEVIISFWIKVF